MMGSTSFWLDHFGAARFSVAFLEWPILSLVHFGEDLFGANFMQFFSFSVFRSEPFFLSFMCRLANHYPISMSLFCLSHNVVYLLHFCPNWDRSKINKQGCCLARKVHGNGVIALYRMEK